MLTTGTDNNGCGAKLTKGQGLSPTDPIQQHYKKTGLLGGITGAFGDKKTMYCHHVTSDGQFAVRAAGERTFKTEEEVWDFLGKNCMGRFVYNRGEDALVCGHL